MRSIKMFRFLFISTAILSISEASRLIQYAPRIIGGEVGKIEDFYWQTALLYESEQICGGSIISPTKVLTAAHCVYTIHDIEPLQVRAGSNTWSEGGELKNVSTFFYHPDYHVPTLLNNDIAVIVLSDAFEFGATIGSIALAPKGLVLQPETPVVATGFGTTKVGSSKRDILHYVIMPIVSQADCLKAYENYPGFAEITDHMICAGFYGVGGKDTCNGDSGGPLVFYSNETGPILYGIISWGNECADPNFPGVFAKVSVFNEWIEEIPSEIEDTFSDY